MSDRKRASRCTFCGNVHRNRRDYRECRARRGSPPPEAKVDHAGDPERSETTRYLSDPLRGNKRAHAISRKHRAGWAPRRIAKHLGISLKEVNDVLEAR